jgi:hypothetical protein
MGKTEVAIAKRNLEFLRMRDLGKEYGITDLIGRPQYTAFKANTPIDILQVYNDSSIPGADDYLIPLSAQKIDIDNKVRFGYREGYCLC